MTPLTLRATTRTLGVLFTLTGCAGLLAEQSFEKLLTPLVGASTPAAAMVLSVYFLGLTLGSFLYPRLRRPGWAPLRGYGLLEAGIGAWALLLALFHPYLSSALTPLLRLGFGNFWILEGLRFLAACAWILPPTLFMGATFPAVVDALDAIRAPKPRRAMSFFYSLNLGGAILGAILGPFLLFPTQGLTGTLLLTALVDLAVAGVVLWVLGRGTLEHPEREPAEPAAAVARPGPEETPRRGHAVLLLIGFFSGMLFFALEILWTHLIGVALGNSVYAFAAMLAAVLAGLFIGGCLSVALWREDRPVSPLATSILLLLGSLALAWQKTLWDGVPHSLMLWGAGLTEFWQGELLRLFQAFRLLLPPSILLGMVYPSLFRMGLFPERDRVRLAARLGGVNAVGCVLGALLCGFWLIPRFGSEGTLVALGLVALACGLALALAYGNRRARVAGTAAAALVALAWGAAPPWDRLALTSGEHVYFRASHVREGSQLRFFHEDILGGITTVVHEPALPVTGGGTAAATGVTTLLTNGKFQANDAGEMDAQTGFAVVPILHVAEPRDALVIGLGSGRSASVVRRFGFASIDIAEISPGIVTAAQRYFAHVNGRILDQPGVRLHLEDGRNLLLLSPRRYDLITMEISSIWFSGSTSLYSREFYELCRRRLKPGGVMQQWIQVHHIGVEELGAVIATMRASFPHVSFWVVGGQGILVGSVEPQRIQRAAVETCLRVNPWGDPVEAALARRLVQMLAGRLLSPEDVTSLQSLGLFEINTDRNRYLEYATPRYNLVRLPLEQINVRVLSRFASLTLPEPKPDWPEAFRESARRLTPKLQREVLGIGPAQFSPGGSNSR